jgi:integrase
LTAARRTEAAQMKRGELSAADWEHPVDWTLPAARNKAKVDLIRPLSASARAALARLPKLAGCEFVFSTDGASPISGFSHFKEKFDEVCGVEGWGLHDLRRTARSLMSRAGVDSDHTERCLGHLIPGARRVYDRHQFHAEKQRAYEALATQIQLILQPPNSNVLSMPARG